MSDFQKIGDNLMFIRMINPEAPAESGYCDFYLKRHERGWVPIRPSEFDHLRAGLDKVQS